MRHLTVTLSLLAMLPGCAYQQAIKQGETAAAAQDWDSAYAAYRFADDLKPGTADAKAAEARASAAEAQLAKAEDAVARGEYLEAAARIEGARHLDPEHARIPEVHAAATEALLSDLDSRLEGEDDLHETYTFVAMAKELAPRSPEVEDAAATMRERVEAKVRSELDEDQHASARRTAALIAELEPEHATRGRAVEAQVTDAWVESLTAKAKRAEKYKPGLAAVYWARAHEVGGSDDLLEVSKTFLEAAAPKAAVKVFVDTKGSGGRHYKLRTGLREGLEASPGVKAGWGSSWDLKATVTANREDCEETKKTEDHSKEYVAGTKQVPNPAYAEVTEALDKAEAERKALSAALEEEKSELGTATAETKALEGSRERKQKQLETANKALEETNEQIALSGDRVKEAEAHLASAKAAGEESAIAEAEEKLALVQGFHDDWKSKRASDKERVETAQAELDAVDAELAPGKASVERLTAAIAESDKALGVADQQVVQLQAKKDATDEELTEDVMDTAKWTDTTWTLTCDAPATAWFATRWDTERDKKQAIEATVATTDLSRPGHEGAKIEVDAKEYPKSKDELIAELAQTSHKAVADAIEAFVVESFTTRLEQALSDNEDVDSATDTLVSIINGAPERVDEATRNKIKAYLMLHYGLEDATVVGVGPAAAPEAADEAPAEEGDAEGESTDEGDEAPAEEAEAPAEGEES